MTPGQREASEALARARAAVRTTEASTAEITATAAQLRELRQRNHFAEALYMLFQGGQ